MKPIIAIVGRTNVGKSTLFNRLVGKQVAIIEDLPGTTRDRIFADANLGDCTATLVDTGGLGMLSDSIIDKEVNKQVQIAVNEADIVIFMVNVKDGLLAVDQEIANGLRKSHKPIVLVVNKVDNSILEEQIGEFFQLGLGTPIPVSAYHNRGLGSLIDVIQPLLLTRGEVQEVVELPKIAIVGRPNVGKSMLLNAIIGDERVIVHSNPGTTRDAIDTTFNYPGQDVILIDTAGIRRRGKSGTGVDFYSLIRSLRAISRCDVALLVVDASEFITAQDLHIAGYIKQAYKGMILVLNKSDLLSKENRSKLDTYISKHLKFMAYVPALYTSAKNGDGVAQILPQSLKIWQERQKKLSDEVIDKLVRNAVEKNSPPPKGLKRLEIMRAYQDSINPPGFTLIVNDPELLHFSYQRYLENQIRQEFGFQGTSLRLNFKQAAKRRKKLTKRGASVN